MQPSNQRTRLFRFDAFEVDLENAELRKDGQVIALQEKPYQLLTLFLARAGQVVTREEIRDRLWGKGTFIDFDGSLNQAVKKLRDALGDSAANPQFIKTVSRRGYRFVPQVTAAGGLNEAEVPSTEVLQLVPRARRGRSRFAPPGLVPALWIGVSGLAAIMIGTWWTEHFSKRAEAVRAWRTGMELLRRRDLPSARSAAVELRRAIQLRPEFAPAWAGLAEAGVLFLNINDASGPLEMAQRSVRLDPDCGECRATLGFIFFTRFWKWNEAEEQLQHAVSLRPHDPQIRFWFAQLQAARGRPKECVKLLDDAISKAPHAFNLLIMRAGCLYFARDYQGVLETTGKALAVNHSSASTWRARALFLTGKHREAVRSLAYDMGANSSRSAQWVAESAESFERRYDSAGLKGALGELLELTGSPHAHRVHSFNRATWFMLLGEHEPALKELQTAVATKPPPFDVVYLGVDPLFDPVRPRPEFQDLLLRMGLTDRGVLLK